MDSITDHMLLHPLAYIDNQQRISYRNRNIKISLLCITTSILIIGFDLVLSQAGISLSSGLSISQPGTRGSSLAEGLTLALLVVEFGAAPYGAYRLITMRRHTNKLALRYLAESNPELKQVLDARSITSEKRLTSMVNATARIVTTFLILFICLLSLAIAGSIAFFVSRT